MVTEERNAIASLSIDDGETWTEYEGMGTFPSMETNVDSAWGKPCNTISFTWPLQHDSIALDAKRFLDSLISKEEKRLHHNLFHHKRWRTRKKALKRLLGMGYTVTYYN